MAEFNPQVNFDREPQFLNYSRGFRDTASSGLVQGVAQATSDKIQATDRALNLRAQEEVRAAVNETDTKIMGIDNYSPPQDPLESEVKSQVRNLGAKKKAFENGSISPEHYYATIQAKVKEVRTRYSGYNDTIDSELSSLGIDPNYQRKKLLADAENARNAASARQSETEKNNRELIERTLFSTPVSPELREKLSQPGAHLDPELIRQAKLKSSEWSSIKGIAEVRKLKAEALGDDDKNKAKELATSYSSELMVYAAGVAESSYDYQTLQKSVTKIQEQVAKGETPAEEEVTALQGQLAKVRSAMEQGKLTIKSRYTDTAGLFLSEMKQADELYNSYLDGMEKAITDRNTGMLTFFMGRLERIKQKAGVDVVTESETMRELAGTREAVGETVMVQQYNTNALQTQNILSAAIKNEVLHDVSLGRVKSVREALAKGDNLEKLSAEDVKSVMDGHLSLMLSPDTKPEGRRNAMNAWYGDDNKILWDDLFDNTNLSDADKRAYAARLTSSQMLEAIKKTGDPKVLENFVNTTSYISAKLNRNTGQDINNINQFSSNNYVTWDDKNSKFVLSERNAPISNSALRIANQGLAFNNRQAGRNQEAVDNANESLGALDRAWTALGLTDEEKKGLRQQYINAWGIDLNIPKAGNVLERLDAIPVNPRGAPGVNTNPQNPAIRGGGGANNVRGDAMDDALAAGKERLANPETIDDLLAKDVVIREMNKAKEEAGMPQLDSVTGTGTEIRELMQMRAKATSYDEWKKFDTEIKSLRNSGNPQGQPPPADFQPAIPPIGPQSEFRSRTPTTRERVMDSLTAVGMPPDQASKVGQLAEFFAGPADTPGEIALGALSLVPGTGTALKLGAKLPKEALKVIEGGKGIIEDIAKAVDKDLGKDIIKGVETFGNDVNNLAVRSLSAISKPGFDKEATRVVSLIERSGLTDEADKVKQIPYIVQAMSNHVEYGQQLVRNALGKGKSIPKEMQDKLKTEMGALEQGLQERLAIIDKYSKPRIAAEGAGVPGSTSSATLRLADEPLPKDLGAKAVGKPAGEGGRYTDQQLAQIRINQKLYDNKRSLNAASGETEIEQLQQIRRSILREQKDLYK